MVKTTLIKDSVRLKKIESHVWHGDKHILDLCFYKFRVFIIIIIINVLFLIIF